MRRAPRNLYRGLVKRCATAQYQKHSQFKALERVVLTVISALFANRRFQEKQGQTRMKSICLQYYTSLPTTRDKKNVAHITTNAPRQCRTQATRVCLDVTQKKALLSKRALRRSLIQVFHQTRHAIRGTPCTTRPATLCLLIGCGSQARRCGTVRCKVLRRGTTSAELTAAAPAL